MTWSEQGSGSASRATVTLQTDQRQKTAIVLPPFCNAPAMRRA